MPRRSHTTAGIPRPRTTRPLIGRPIAELPTPALLLDLPMLRANIAAMAGWAADRIQLRPHAKIHKCVEIARLQQEAGAIGSTTATVNEACALIRAGVREVLIANEVGGPESLALVAELAGEASVIVAADDPKLVLWLSAAASAAGTEIGVLIEVDVGMGRGGVRSLEEAHVVADRVGSLPGLRLRGAMGYEGHAVLEQDRSRRRSLSELAMAKLLHYVGSLRDAGSDLQIVSAGGTTTYDLTGAVEGVTELQTGTYALMDTSYAPYVPAFEPALSTLGRVVSRHGGRVVLDAGSKAVGVSEVSAPRPRPVGLTLTGLHEEHALIDVAEGPGPELGDVVELVVGYCGGAVNANDAYIVVEDGVVVDVWPIVARGGVQESVQ
jgi:D-threonine aldolase